MSDDDNFERHRDMFARRGGKTGNLKPRDTSVVSIVEKIIEKEILDIHDKLDSGESAYVLHVSPNGGFNGDVSSLSIFSREQAKESFEEIIKRNNIDLTDSSKIIIEHISNDKTSQEVVSRRNVLSNNPILVKEVDKYETVGEILNATHKKEIGMSKGFVESIKRNPNKGWLTVNAALGGLFLYQMVESFHRDRKEKVALADMTGNPKPAVFSSLTMGTLINGLFSGISFANVASMLSNGRGH